MRYIPTGPDTWEITGECVRTVRHTERGFEIDGVGGFFPTLRLAAKFIATGDGSNHRAAPLQFTDPIPVSIGKALTLMDEGISLITYFERVRDEHIYASRHS